MSTAAEVTSPTSTFKALSYAERIRKAQDSSEQDAEARMKADTSLTSGAMDSQKSTVMNDDKSPEDGALTLQDELNGDVIRWQEVGASKRKEPKVDKGKVSLDLKSLNGKRDTGLTRVPPSQFESGSSPGGNDSLASKAEPRGAAKSVWRSLATSTIPAPPADIQSLSTGSQPIVNSGNLAAVTPPLPAMPTAAGPSQPVGPPTTNIWQTRKEKMTGVLSANAVASSSSSSIAYPSPASASKNATKGAVKTINSSGNVSPKKATLDPQVGARPSSKSAKNTGGSGSSVPLPNLTDATVWPDVSLAATASKTTKPSNPSKPTASTTDDVDDPTVPATAPKKKRWTAIPAAEMQEALDRAQRQKKADHAAESKNRKATSTTATDSGAKAGGPTSAGPKKGAAGPGGTKASRPGSVPAGNEMSKKAKANAAKNERTGQDASIIKLVEPALRKAAEVPSSGLDDSAVSGSLKKDIKDGFADDVLSINVPTTPQGGANNLPMEESPSTRQKGSANDRDKTRTHLSGTGPTGKAQNPSQGNPVAGTSQISNQQTVPRPGNSGGQGRGGRGGRVARGGRGGGSHGALGRSQSEQHSPLTSPPNGRSPSLPNHGANQGLGRRLTEGQATQGSAVYSYAQPYYAPYHFPVVTGGFAGPADGNLEAYGQANYGGGVAPFPRPVTQIPGLDTLRSFILGQLEYYFSMQNLAMDFFLRQQMDNQGWVDLTMISSFNRIKSLTADVDTVKEVASLSTILEMCDQNIRLAHDQWRQWVLPDARPSAIGSDGQKSAYTGEMPFGMPGGDLTSQARDKLVGDIHRDVMRSTPTHLQAASGLTKSVPGGLEAESAASQTTTTDEAHATKTNTPATSVSDDPDPHDKLEIIL